MMRSNVQLFLLTFLKHWTQHSLYRRVSGRVCHWRPAQTNCFRCFKMLPSIRLSFLLAASTFLQSHRSSYIDLSPHCRATRAVDSGRKSLNRKRIVNARVDANYRHVHVSLSLDQTDKRLDGGVRIQIHIFNWILLGLKKHHWSSRKTKYKLSQYNTERAMVKAGGERKGKKDWKQTRSQKRRKWASLDECTNDPFFEQLFFFSWHCQ